MGIFMRLANISNILLSMPNIPDIFIIIIIIIIISSSSSSSSSSSIFWGGRGKQ